MLSFLFPDVSVTYNISPPRILADYVKLLDIFEILFKQNTVVVVY